MSSVLVDTSIWVAHFRTPNHALRTLIEREQLHNRGCGAVDVALLASALLTPGVRLWTADKSLQSLSQKLSIDHGHIGLR